MKVRRTGQPALCLGIVLAMLLVGALSPASGAEENDPGAQVAGRAAAYVLSIVPANDTQRVNLSTPQKSATYGFEVKNTGDTSLPSLDLELSPWTSALANWSYVFIPAMPVEINPSEIKTILLTIYPDQNAEAKRYTFDIRGKAGVQANSVSINLDILQFAGVEVRPPPSKKGDPGSTLEFDFEIVNRGSGKDRFFAEPVMVAVPAIVPVLKDLNNWTTDIAPGKSAFKTVQVTIPYDWRTTDDTGGLQLSIAVTSAFDNRISDVNWTLILVNHIYDIALDVYYLHPSVLPGGQADFNITVFNLRNGQDNVSLLLNYTFDRTGWTTSLGKNLFNLQPGAEATTKLKVTPPLGALAGNYTINILARSSGPAGAPIERSEAVTITVLPVRKLQVPTDIIASPMGPGEAQRISITFLNTGNDEDTVNLTILEKPANWTASLDLSRNISVGSGLSRSIELTVLASSSYSDSQARNYAIRLQLTNSDRGSTWNITVTVPIRPVCEWDFSVQEPTMVEVNLFLGNRHTFSIDLSNRGNTPDEPSLSLTGSGASWGTLDSSIVHLGFGESRTARLEVTVPPTTPRGTYDIKVTATSRVSPGLYATRDIFLFVFNEDPASKLPRLELYSPRPSITVTEGDIVELAISVRCAGSNISNVSLLVTQSGSRPLTVTVLTASSDLAVGNNVTYVVRVQVPRTDGATKKWTLTAKAMGSGVTSLGLTIQLTARPAPGAVYSVESMGLALAIFIALGGLAWGWNETVLLALLTLFLPLYSKIRRDEVLDRYLRGKIHGYIIANPGEHYSSIKAQLKLKNGTLAYHLRVLEREGYIKSARDGVFKRFYPIDAAVPRKRKEFSSIQEIVLENIRSDPGITQNALAGKMGVSSQVVNYHVRSLATAGAVRLERVGRETRCFVTGPDRNT